MSQRGRKTYSGAADLNADPMKAAEKRRQAKIAQAKAGKVLPEQPGIEHPAPGTATVQFDRRTGTVRP
jgi:hypothetical protein